VYKLETNERETQMFDVIVNVVMFGAMIVPALVVMSKLQNNIDTAKADADRSAALLARK